MPTDNKSEIVIFKTADEKISVEVRFEGETVWLTQAQLVDLYGSSKANVSDVAAGVKLPKNAGEKFPLLGI